MSTLRRRRVKKMHLRIPIGCGKFRPRDRRNTFETSSQDFLACPGHILNVVTLLPSSSYPIRPVLLLISVHLLLYLTLALRKTDRKTSCIKISPREERKRNWFSLGQVPGMNNANFCPLSPKIPRLLSVRVDFGAWRHSAAADKQIYPTQLPCSLSPS